MLLIKISFISFPINDLRKIPTVSYFVGSLKKNLYLRLELFKFVSD